jgi:class 3 adenylate cyclase
VDTSQYAKSLRRPDEHGEYEHGTADIVDLGDMTVGRIVVEPGWRWSEHLRPIVGGEWCEVRHAGVILAGRFGYTFEDGTTLEVGPDDVFDVPAGHDGYTVGDETCVMLEWSGARSTRGFTVGAGKRIVTTMLFTDLVGSTEMATRLGDAPWHDLLSRHYDSIRRELDRFGGREVETTGDGMLATFDAAATALQCAAEIIRDAIWLGLHVRAGVHTGEVQQFGSRLRGVAVHEAARVMAKAAPDEVVTSETTRVLAAAADLAFEDRGLHRLKGLEGERHLYAFIPKPGAGGTGRP